MQHWKFLRIGPGNINKVEVNGVEISDKCEIAEAFNTHFTEIGENLVNKIPIADTDPISYIKPTNSVFAFKTIDVTQVKNLIMKINVNKSSGLDDISNKLLKLAADIVSQSLRTFSRRHVVRVFIQMIGN